MKKLESPLSFSFVFAHSIYEEDENEKKAKDTWEKIADSLVGGDYMPLRPLDIKRFRLKDRCKSYAAPHADFVGILLLENEKADSSCLMQLEFLQVLRPLKRPVAGGSCKFPVSVDARARLVHLHTGVHMHISQLKLWVRVVSESFTGCTPGSGLWVKIKDIVSKDSPSFTSTSDLLFLSLIPGLDAQGNQFGNPLLIQQKLCFSVVHIEKDEEK